MKINPYVYIFKQVRVNIRSERRVIKLIRVYKSFHAHGYVSMYVNVKKYKCNL